MKILNKIKVSLAENMPFVAYKKPNKKTVTAFFQKDDTLYTTQDYKEKGFVFAPFDDKKTSILIPDSSSDFYEETLNLKEEEWEIKNYESENSREHHTAIVEKGIEAINKEHFKKVVLSRKETLKREDTEIILVFKRLLQLYNNACVYIWFHPKVGLWMGATPETLIKINNSSFETMSLAGTQVYKAEVQWKEKEIEEQQLVTDYVLQKLQSVCSLVEASNVETIRAGNLLHLKTSIKGEFNCNSSELIHLLHPTPAVCGFPKNKSKDFILNNEGYDRTFYTGFLGELNMPDSELFVNLRCMEIEEHKINIYVGGGITKESNSEKEWEETVAKALTMKRVL